MNDVQPLVEMMFETEFQDDVVSLRSQTQKKHSQRVLFFGGEDGIRTHGAL